MSPTLTTTCALAVAASGARNISITRPNIIFFILPQMLPKPK